MEKIEQGQGIECFGVGVCVCVSVCKWPQFGGAVPAKVAFEEGLKEVSRWALGSLGKMRTKAKGMKWDQVWCVPETARRPVWVSMALMAEDLIVLCSGDRSD